MKTLIKRRAAPYSKELGCALAYSGEGQEEEERKKREGWRVKAIGVTEVSEIRYFPKADSVSSITIVKSFAIRDSAGANQDTITTGIKVEPFKHKFKAPPPKSGS